MLTKKFATFVENLQKFFHTFGEGIFEKEHFFSFSMTIFVPFG